MTVQSLKSFLYRWRYSSVKRQISGFTLIELLIGTVIASIAVSGLLYLVVYLIQNNQQQSAKTETQRDTQTALNFINSELRNAVYIYSGDCLFNGTNPPANTCPGVVNYIPAQTSSIPILAFWKLDPLPTPLQTQCNAGTAPPTVPCFSGQTYSLVVYFLSKDPGGTTPPTWSGKARITRYSLTRYNANGIDQSASPIGVGGGYVDPNQTGVTFSSWPLQTSGTIVTNLQTGAGGVPTGAGTAAVALIDFVDDKARASTGDDNVVCPTVNGVQYLVTPNAATLTQYVIAPFDTSDKNIRSFYACVRPAGAYNQDVMVFLRGNAFGRPGLQGMSDGAFLPRVQTQVLGRGIVNEVPAALK